MKKKLLLSFVLSFSVVSVMLAQKPDQLLNSYNYKRAMELIENKGDKNEALEYLFKETNEHPKNGYAYYMIGLLYNDADMAGDALEPINKAITLLQKDKEWLPYAYRQRADIYLKLENENAALTDWASALKANPKDVRTLSDRAEYYYQRDMYAQSDADFERICQFEPGNSYGYMGKGRNALENEKYNEALDLFSYAIKLDQTYSQAYAYRAECKLRLGYVNEGIDDIITALDIDDNSRASRLMLMIGEPDVNTLITKLKVQQLKKPNSSSWPWYLGIVYESEEKYMKAIEWYKECIKIEPGDVPYYRISNCYSELGDYQLALDNIEMAAQLDPEDSDYVQAKADLLYDMGRGDEAIAAYDSYIKSNPEFYGGYYRRGFMKDNLNDIDGAIEDYSTCIVLKPDYAYAYMGRADKYLLKGDKEAAMKDYRAVIALDTICGENNCAQYAYLGLGDVEKAKSFQYAILANSSSAGNYYDAACLFSRMGDTASSINFLKNSLEKGFTRFAHIRNDDDLDNIRDIQEFKDLIEEYETKYLEEQNKKRVEEGLPEKREEHVSEIPFTVEGGNCYVKCSINDLPMRFVFDTGASDVSISMVEASFMMKNGYLNNSDVIGSARFSDALGNVSEGTVINLKKVKFGDVELDNVRASVVRNQKAPLLLGQTVLSRIGKIEIDNQKRVIVVKYMK